MTEKLYLIVLAAEKAAEVGFWASIPAGVWALIGTIIGTIGLRLLEKWLNRNREKHDIRRDLNAEIATLQERLDKVEDEVTHFRTLYYAEQEKVALLRVMVIQLGGELPETTVTKSAQGATE